MSGKSVRVRVAWDTDDQGDCGLPDIVVVPGHVVEADDDDGTIADWLSDEYGFCVHGFSFIGNDGESAAETQ